MTVQASFRLNAKYQRLLMTTVFFIGVLLILIAMSVLGGAILGLLPVASAGLSLAPLISGIASISAAVFLSH